MSTKGFNLLQDSTLPPDAWDNIYQWVNRVGRVILIVVEIIVVISFVARVVIDTQTKELKQVEEATQQSLNASRVNELRFLDYQSRFGAYREVWNQGSSYKEVIADIIELTPRSIQNVAISIKENIITFKGKAPIAQVNTLETALKSSELFSRVTVPEISTEAQASGSRNLEVEFSIRIEIKPDVLKMREKIGGSGTSQGATVNGIDTFETIDETESYPTEYIEIDR